MGGGAGDKNIILYSIMLHYISWLVGAVYV